MLALLFRLLAYLPLSCLHSIGAVAGRMVLRLSPRYRQHVFANLAQSGLIDAAQGPEQLSHFARKVAAETGKSFMELPYVWLRPAAQVLTRTRTTDWAVIEQARTSGQGIIYLTPHLGCFEITGPYLAAMPAHEHHPLTALYRAPRQAWLAPLMQRGRARAGMAMAAADVRGVRQLARALKRGEAVCILPDQVPNAGVGAWADFFGKPAYTMTLPAKLQQMSGAHIVLMYGERLPRGQGWTIHFSSFDEALSANVEHAAQQINAAMEGLIRCCPEQYLWGYARYKKPRGVMGPDLAPTSTRNADDVHPEDQT